ncbi:MAG: acylphosphatase [Gemmatimonadaceae bacterium]|nr:acylphosphatase [Gemmatimonadaceae bacterium]
MPVAHLRVTGLVQGVGFRWFVRVSARRLRLHGWVTNRRDGTVEIAAEGSDESLAQLRRLVSRGPDGASVEEVVDLDPLTEELEFPFMMRK